jgi:3-keto-disaccharide hydrolase
MDLATQLSAKYLYDDFLEGQYNLNNNEVSPNGKWFHWYSGSHSKPGNQGVRPSTTTLGNVFFLESPAPIHEGQTYSSLTLSTRSYKNFHMNLDVRTVSQTRENSPPNPWEVAWVFWHAVGNGTDEMDRTHFYYFLVKTNGLDIGKYDGGTNPDSQQIIAIKYYPLETSIYNKIGAWYNLDIIVLNDHITVKVNNATAFDIINSASFVSGRIGLYNEDSKTEFRNIYIKPIC